MTAKSSDAIASELFATKSTLPGGKIVFDDEIPCVDEIRLDAGWVDLISSEAEG